MLVDVAVPNVGESIARVRIISWLISDKAVVAAEAPLFEMETDKATLTVHAEQAGKITILADAGSEVDVGAVVAQIETSGLQTEAAEKTSTAANEQVLAESKFAPSASPAAQKLLREHGLRPENLGAGSGRSGRITKGDALALVALSSSSPEAQSLPKTEPMPAKTAAPATARKLRAGERRERMSMLRQSISKRLVAVKNETAMLTTFNEADLSMLQKLRKDKGEAFLARHGIKLGLMSFFIKAAAIALQEFPEANTYVEGYDVIYHDYIDIGVAVSTPRGLMVPVLRAVETMKLSEIEKQLAAMAEKARQGSISLEEMSGGTFTITNGGVFGSMLSTPILNPPQVAILGMHSIIERPIAAAGQVVIRPMMYLALSYDHRQLDGKSSVGFLKRIRELLENPEGIYHD